MKMIRILIADDHEMVRSGYRRLLESTTLYEVVGESSSGNETVSLFKSLLPDIVLLDVMMPGIGVADVIKRIKSYKKTTSILVVTLYDHPSLVERCFKAGAQGFITKSSSGRTLIEGLKKISQKRHFISPDLAEILAINQLSTETPSLLSSLTPREFDVFLRIARGQPITKISNEMHLSKKTVSNYSSKIKKRLNVTTTAAFVHLAMQEHLIDCNESFRSDNSLMKTNTQAAREAV